MELVSTMEISGEEREIADAYAREQIEGINSNLDGLEYGEVAGGKNLFDGEFTNTVIDIGGNYTQRNLKEEFGSINNLNGIMYTTFGGYLKKGTYTFSYTNGAWLSLNRVAIAGTNCESVTINVRNSYTWTQNVDGFTYFGIEGDNSETGTVDTPFSTTPDIMIEKGSTATTPYEPYIPSVKMLAEEVSEQNESLGCLEFNGWTIPNDMPLKDASLVDKVDMGSLTWNYISSGQFFYADLAGGKIGSKNAYCSRYNLSSSSSYGGMANKEFMLSVSSETVSRVFLKDTTYTDTTALKNSLNGQYLYFERVTAKTFTDGQNAIDKLKNDLSKQCKKDDITTNETLIGTFNGKNYYRKLFTGISGSGGSVTVNVGEKIEIYNYYGRAYTYGQSGASDVKYPIPNKNYYIDSQNASETSFQLTIPTSSDTRKIDLVIEYTKVDE